MKPPVLAAIVLLALAAPLHLAAPVHAEDDDTNTIDDTPHITIVGSARTEVAPDLAIITLGVTSHQATAVAAADAVAANAKAVVDAAKAQGVKDPDIATQSVNLAQTFDDLRDPQGRFTGRKATGFDASNTVLIRIRDLAKAGRLAQSLIDKGANVFDGIAFTVENPQPLLDRLAAEATANARRQAEMVAQAAGVKLGRVLSIERPNVGNSTHTPPFAAMARVAPVAPKEMPIQGGTTRLEAEMEVTWSLDR